jgi:hypothetical protein
MIINMVVGLLLVLSSYSALAADPCPPAGRRVEWMAQCFETKGDTRYVKHTLIRRLAFNRHGMATVTISDPRELVAVDRQGKVIIAGIRHGGDFDYPNAENDLGRFYLTAREAAGQPRERCGYFRSDSFDIVVPARFDACDPFQSGEAMVCSDCRSYCTSPDCQDRVMVGGQAMVLGTNGEVQRTLALPDMAHLCAPPASLVTGKYGRGQKTWVHCVETRATPDKSFP